MGSETAFAGPPDWSNLAVIHRNTLPPRSHFFVFPDEASALSRHLDEAEALCLSGKWKVHVANSPFEAPSGFESPSFNSSGWQEVQVPGLWQLQGFGKPQYSNVNYPFPVDPPHVPMERNQCGSYVRTFLLPQLFENNHLRLRFEGVDSSFHVYLNGKELGYSQGSRNPSEFDVTDSVVKDTPNTLAVRVYQYCDGSYLEDQDQWRLSGIFRDVYLLCLPHNRVEDIHIRTILDESYTDAILSVKCKITGAGEALVRLLDADKQIILDKNLQLNGDVEVREPVKDPRKWTAEDPYLYDLLLSFHGRTIIQRVGFRSTQIKDGLFQVNGKPITLRGVNRHEHHPLYARSVPLDFLRRDLVMMKKHNINAIRTSHQPNDPRLYDLTDELGFWVMDEADLECHGFASVAEASLSPEEQRLTYEERKSLTYREASNWTSDNSEWEEAYVDRAQQLVIRDKNHPSVIMWSLGNEAFYGRNFQSMYDWMRQYDETRFIHYEGDTEARTVDVYSQMYPTVDAIIQFAQELNFSKPLILCEFAHAMGNGPGNLKEYVDAFYNHRRLQGGFVWEWANHGLLTQTEEGEQYYAYGGDFDEEVHDYNFVMDGLCFSDHSPGPGLVEYAKAIEPVQLVEGSSKDSIQIINRYDFLSLDHLRCEYSYATFNPSRSCHSIDIPRGIGPGKMALLRIPDIPSDLNGKCYAIDIEFYLDVPTLWAGRSHRVTWLQIPVDLQMSIPPQLSLSSPQLPPCSAEIEVIRTTNTLIMNHLISDTSFEFSLSSGLLVGFRKGSTELLRSGPVISFYRPLTDNDRPQDGQDWLSKRLHQAKSFVRNITWKVEGDCAKVIVKARSAPPVLAWSIDTVTTYTISRPATKTSAFSAKAGSRTGVALSIRVEGTPAGDVPPTLARIGLTLSLQPHFSTVTWFGRGPGQSYVDSKHSQRLGHWTRNVEDLWIPYEFPQENGNRTDVRFVEFLSSSATIRASFPKSKQGGNFSASHFLERDIDECTHPWQLAKRKREEVVIRLDWAHHGLGSGSCGPKTLEKYALKCAPFDYEVQLE